MQKLVETRVFVPYLALAFLEIKASEAPPKRPSSIGPNETAIVSALRYISGWIVTYI